MSAQKLALFRMVLSISTTSRMLTMVGVLGDADRGQQVLLVLLGAGLAAELLTLEHHVHGQLRPVDAAAGDTSYHCRAVA